MVVKVERSLIVRIGMFLSCFNCMLEVIILFDLNLALCSLRTLYIITFLSHCLAPLHYQLIFFEVFIK